MVGKVIELDVRPLMPWDRHEKIFKVFDELEIGDTLLLTNDHDPRPLHYQMMHEKEGQFEWKSEEKGPKHWVAVIKKAKKA